MKKGINELLSYLSKNIASVTLATNAVEITNETIEVLKDAKNITVQASVDGLEENHDRIRGVRGAFQKTISNIKILANNGIYVVAAFTMNDDNNDEIEKVIELSKELGCVGVNIGLTTNAGRAKDNSIKTNIANSFESIVRTMHKKHTTNHFFVGVDVCEATINKMMDDIEYPNKCGAGYRGFHISPCGDVKMCPGIDKIKLGNIKNQKLTKILDISNVRELMYIPSPTREKCGSCDLYASCGNCLANMLEKNNEECIIQRGLQLQKR